MSKEFVFLTVFIKLQKVFWLEYDSVTEALLQYTKPQTFPCKIWRFYTDGGYFRISNL